MMEIGDRVRNARYYGSIPRSVYGEVIKVSKVTSLVRWENVHLINGRPILFWYRGRERVVPNTSRMAHHNLELVERKGGPW